MNFKQELDARITVTEKIINQYMPPIEGYQKTVIDAMHYSIQAGGKRIRPILLLEAYQMFGGTTKVAEPFAAAIEMIHTYSLIHDDLPAMDNDEYRRGRKTTHVVYNEAMAILAGDGLLNYAFETAVKAATIEDNKGIIESISILGRKSGIYGMLGGQTADIEAEQKGFILDEEQIIFIHENKTAALIQASLMIGAMLAGATDDEVEKMRKIGYYVGVAFQIQDDILDVTSTTEKLGKPVGSDAKNNKTTYVSIKGIEKSREDVKKWSMEAINLINSLNKDTEFLSEMVIQLIQRKR